MNAILEGFRLTKLIAYLSASMAAVIVLLSWIGMLFFLDFGQFARGLQLAVVTVVVGGAVAVVAGAGRALRVALQRPVVEGDPEPVEYAVFADLAEEVEL